MEGLFHLIPAAAAPDRNALGQIAENRQKDVPLKIRSFREVPGDPSVLCDMSDQRRHGVGHDHGIDHGQMVGADDPGAFVLPEMKSAFLSDPV